jgi:hypothetical protein
MHSVGSNNNSNGKENDIDTREQPTLTTESPKGGNDQISEPSIKKDFLKRKRKANAPLSFPSLNKENVASPTTAKKRQRQDFVNERPTDRSTPTTTSPLVALSSFSCYTLTQPLERVWNGFTLSLSDSPLDTSERQRSVPASHIHSGDRSTTFPPLQRRNSFVSSPICGMDSLHSCRFSYLDGDGNPVVKKEQAAVRIEEGTYPI